MKAQSNVQLQPLILSSLLPSAPLQSYFAPANVKIFVPLFFGSSTTAESLIAAVEEVRRYWDLLTQRLKAGGGWLVDRRYTAADAGFCAAILQETVLLGESERPRGYAEWPTCLA